VEKVLFTYKPSEKQFSVQKSPVGSMSVGTIVPGVENSGFFQVVAKIIFQVRYSSGEI